MDDLGRAKELFLAGLAHQEKGELSEAERLYRQALELAPERPSVINNLAVVLLRSGRFFEAEPLCRKLLSIIPHDATAILNLGNCQLALKFPTEALGSFDRALVIRPGYVEALVGRGVALMDLGRLADALASYDAALASNRDSVEALCNRGVCLRRLQRFEEALSSYDQALATDPRCAEAFAGRGNVLLDLNRSEEALAACERALSIKPDLAEAHFNRANALVSLDRQQEALQAGAKAMALRPDFAAARWIFAMSQLPAVYEAEGDPERCRTAFSEELGKLSEWFGTHDVDDDPEAMVWQPFYLAYQERDNRDLLARYGRLSAEIMRRWAERQGLPRVQPPKRDVIRLGIVSAHIFEHSVWNALVKSWIKDLDRGRFEVDVFYLGRKQDRETLFAKSHTSRFEEAPKSLREWVEVILDRQADVLIYPEIGMDAMTGKLASSRLAPVQVASWGHPETSGLPTIDCYLSAEAFEPPGAQRYYTERLVTLPGTGCFCEESPGTAVEPDLPRLGIDPESAIFICPGTPFKYAPEHDWIFPAIARKLERCQFVFFTHPLSEKLRRRLKAAFERDGLDFQRYVIFIPFQPRAGFYGLMKRARLLLDTIGFSGFNTAMQAIECSLPIVTREGRFMRGRLASGLLKRVGLSELVAGSEEEYVTMAVRFGRDVEYAEQTRARVGRARASSRGDLAAIRDLEGVLSQVTRTRH